MIKKALILLVSINLFILSLFSSFTVHKTSAQGLNDAVQDISELWIHKWYGETWFPTWYEKVYSSDTPESEIFGERYTAAQVQWVFYSIVSMFLNIIPGSPDIIICATRNDLNSCSESILKYLEALNPISEVKTNDNFLTFLQNNPISGVGYVTDTFNRLGFVSTVNAQGFGYNNAGNAFIGMWRATRDISYGLLVVALIAISFMIMFQIKIDPKTVISVQTSIPKIAIAIVLITFSYAIAGFAIDLMYVVIGLLATWISSSGLSQMDIPSLFKEMTRDSLTLMYLYWFEMMASIFKVIGQNIGLGILMLFAGLFAIIVIVWWSLKIMFIVFKNFALLVITIITGPLEIMLGVITNSMGFNTWFKRLISYLAVYPLMGVMFFFSFFFLNQGNSATSAFANHTPFQPATDIISQNAWTPPMTAATVTGLSFVWILVSFAIFSEIPKVVEIVQSFMQGKSFAFGSGINEAENTLKGTGKAGLQWGVSSAENIFTRASQGKGTPAIINVAKILFGLK